MIMLNTTLVIAHMDLLASSVNSLLIGVAQIHA